MTPSGPARSDGPGRRRLLRGLPACTWVWASALAGVARAQPPAPAEPPPGTVHTVAPGQRLDAVLARAAEGDEVRLLPGEHRAQAGVVLQRRLRIRGAGAERTVLRADGAHAEGKALIVVRDGTIAIEDLHFTGTRVPDGNGAGIRFERGALTVRRCRFTDNQNGILTGNVAEAALTVEDCDFAEAPSGGRLPHLLYVGSIGRLTLRGSRLAGGRRGHLVKSRARENHVVCNQLVDGAGGQAAYELEFPNGGIAFVIGNVLGQATGTSNPVMLSFGVEGQRDGREQGLYVAHNTFVNFGLKPALFVRVAEDRLGAEPPQRIVNNLFLGLGAPDLGASDLAAGNVLAPRSVLRDADTGDWRLTPGSWLRGRAVDPGIARGVPLRPTEQFTAPTGTRALTVPARWSPGAYQD